MDYTKDKSDQLVVITGPTATGKTQVAVRLAALLDGEIISADSRQVYRGMDIGTGKDLQDYVADGRLVPYHLIDIADPGEEYDVYTFQRDFVQAFREITRRGRQAVLCGGTGLYIDAIISGYRLIRVPKDPLLRKELDQMSMQSLTDMLAGMKALHNTTDITDKNRLIRAIEIARYEEEHPDERPALPPMKPVIFAIHFERSELRERITKRLKVRLQDGMVDEVRRLLEGGLEPAQLRFYGLEYRYVTDYVTGRLTHEEMFQKLNIAIHQFAKRQMTWFRRMEKKGHAIHWINGQMPEEKKNQAVLSIINRNNTGKSIRHPG